MDRGIRLRLSPIGIVRSPFKSAEDVPRDCGSIVGKIEVFEEYELGLNGIEKVSHLIVLWLFHKSGGYSLRVKPLHHEGIRGVFATRHPNRPNPIGFTVVELVERKRNMLRVRGIDMVEGTPVLDIKPHAYIWKSGEEH
jgi:tRNA-Thr(GGU) m(6)t(6)A37 methyltransferase TsaA